MTWNCIGVKFSCSSGVFLFQDIMSFFIGLIQEMWPSIITSKQQTNRQANYLSTHTVCLQCTDICHKLLSFVGCTKLHLLLLVCAGMSWVAVCPNNSPCCMPLWPHSSTDTRSKSSQPPPPHVLPSWCARSWRRHAPPQVQK